MGKIRTFLAGLAAGAAAVFFSKKENRDLVVDKAKEAKEKIEEEAETVKNKANAAVKAAKKAK